MARVVFVEPFMGGSHEQFCRTWKKHSCHHIDFVSLPGEFWRWRMRGAAYDLAEKLKEHLNSLAEAKKSVDCLVVSGLVDVAGLLGFARKEVQGLAVALYLHESQLLYPHPKGRPPQDTFALINWSSMLVADQIWFNSRFHSNAIFAALPELLSRQGLPHQGHLDALALCEQKSSVLYPPVELISNGLFEDNATDGAHRSGIQVEAKTTNRFENAKLIKAHKSEKDAHVSEIAHRAEGVLPSHKKSGPLVLWNQRWEHDKAPQRVFKALAKAAEAGIDFHVAIAGESAPFEEREDRKSATGRCFEVLKDRIVLDRFCSREEYLELLAMSDVVISAATHEFFGISIVEAVAGGAVALLPNRLSYPELIPADFHEIVLYEDAEFERRVAEVLRDFEHVKAQTRGLAGAMVRFDTGCTVAALDDAVSGLAGL